MLASQLKIGDFLRYKDIDLRIVDIKYKYLSGPDPSPDFDEGCMVYMTLEDNVVIVKPADHEFGPNALRSVCSSISSMKMR